MNTVEIIEKPASISYQDIKDLLYRSHETTRAKGIHFGTTNLSAEQLEKKVGQDGKCFVALEDGKLVGTVSCKIISYDRWFTSKKVGYLMLVGIDPSCRGRHYYTKLMSKVYDYLESENIPALLLDTAEHNDNQIRISGYYGFDLVDFFRPNDDHYSVRMVKWFTKPPYSKLYAFFRYSVKKAYIKTRYFFKMKRNK